MIALDCGCYCALPNNRIIWHEPSFLTNSVNPEKGEKPEYLTNSHVWKCEIDSKWTAEDSYRMFYEDNFLGAGTEPSQEKKIEYARLRALRDANYPQDAQ